MFITTLRVRRARRDSLSKYLTAAQQKALVDVDGADVLEVLAHGEVVALATVNDPVVTVVWLAPAAEQTTTKARVQKFVASSLPLMAVGERVEQEARQDGSSLRGRAARARQAVRA